MQWPPSALLPKYSYRRKLRKNLLKPVNSLEKFCKTFYRQQFIDYCLLVIPTSLKAEKVICYTDWIEMPLFMCN